MLLICWLGAATCISFGDIDPAYCHLTFVEMAREAEFLAIGDIRPVEGSGKKFLFAFREVIKDEGQRTIPKTIPLATEPALEKAFRNVLVSGKVSNGELTLSHLVELKNERITAYLKQAIALANTGDVRRCLGFYFQHLDSAFPEIADDAHNGFHNASFKELAAASKQYDPNKLIQWLRRDHLYGERLRLYGCLLGLCGRKSDAPFLRAKLGSMLDDIASGVQGVMAGYCLLEPKVGRDYVLSIMVDPKHAFSVRYAALQTAAFLRIEIPGTDRTVIVDQMARAMQSLDMADVIIDELRYSGDWSHANDAFKLLDWRGFRTTSIRMALIRYALDCPTTEAKQFVAARRRDDAELVSGIEDCLRCWKEARALHATARTEDIHADRTITCIYGLRAR